MKNLKTKLVAPLSAVSALAVPVFAFAAESGSGVASSMTTAFTAVQSDFTATVTAIAPIAIGIVGVFLVWKYGISFFKSITGKN